MRSGLFLALASLFLAAAARAEQCNAAAAKEQLAPIAVEKVRENARACAVELRDRIVAKWKYHQIDQEALQKLTPEILVALSYDADKAIDYPEEGAIEEILLVAEAQARKRVPAGGLIRAKNKNEEDVIILSGASEYKVSLKSFRERDLAKRADPLQNVLKKIASESGKAKGATYVIFNVSDMPANLMPALKRAELDHAKNDHVVFLDDLYAKK